MYVYNKISMLPLCRELLVLVRIDDAFGKTEYIGVIAKCRKITQDFTDIERQIDECDEERYIFNGKQITNLDEIWIVTNETISQNAKNKIHRKFKTRKISFIQNTDLIRIIDASFPNFWNNISLLANAFLNQAFDKIIQYENQ